MAEEEDLICDAVEASVEEAGLKGCLRSCCPLVINALNDLRKVKVAEVVSKKALSVAMSGGEMMAANGQEPVIETVIERIDDVRKPPLDENSYR